MIEGFRSSWLLIVDNLGEKSHKSVFDVLPVQSHYGTILVTTRSAVVAEKFRKSLILETISRTSATRQLALTPTTIQGSIDASKVAEALCSESGCFPLAIEKAASYLSATNCSFAEFLTWYQSHGLVTFSR